MSTVSLEFPSPGVFAYDPLRPTYYTEYFSWAMHKHQAALAAAGASVHVENKTPAEQAAAVAQYATGLSTFIDSAVSNISGYLNGDYEAEKPALPALPEIPADLSSIIAFLPGGKIGLALKVGVSLLSGWAKWQDSMRERDPVRLMDKAFFDNGWFGTMVGRQSYLDKIAENIADSGAPVDLSPVVAAIEALTASLVTQDCAANALSIADLFSKAFGSCVPSGLEGVSVYRGLFDALEDLRSVISAISLDIETEKAVKVSLQLIA